MYQVLLKILLFVLLLPVANAQDDTTLVPIDSVDAPAVDLIYQGKPIDQDQAVTLRKQGIDLSLLEPTPNDSWGRPVNTNPMPMPSEGAILDYDSSLAGFGHEISIHRVILGSNAYHLDISTVPHRALLTRALLQRLGYNQYAPKRYKNLRLRFHSLEERKSFLDAVAIDTIKDPATWVQTMPDNSPELTLQDIVLEPGRVEIQNFYWAALPSNFSEGRRALRAILVPLSLCNAPENIDSYRWDFARVLNNSLQTPYPHEIESQRPFDDTTIDDMRWIAHKIATFTVQDWQAIVAQADYPADIAALVLQKIIAKRNQMLASMNIAAQALPYDVHLTNDSVKNGEVIQASFPGYVSRFTYGDAEDLLNTNEMIDLGIMQGIASAMETLATEINQNMIIVGADKYAQEHSQQVINDFIQHFNQNPTQPYSQPISSWGGPIGNFSLAANREVTTGTFYGSDATIQLVDSIGLTATAGYFRGIDGIRNLIPALQASVSVSRSYAHIRSLKSISDALSAPAGDFIIPKLLHDLSSIVGNPKTTTDKSQTLTDYTKAVEDLLANIKDGEMFTVTDSLSGAAGAQVKIPVQLLFPAAPVGIYNQGINVKAQVQGLVLRRITFRRVNDEISNENYLQIYAQSLNTVTGNLTLDFNYWLDIAHFGLEKSKGVAVTRVYNIDSDPKRDQDISKTLALSIQSLLSTNSDASLRANYPFYLLHHDLDESDWQTRFLFFQTKDLVERHRLRIQPPTEKDHPFNPADFERSFYAYRMNSLTGFNFMALLSDIVSAVSQGKGDFNSGSSDNPAYSLFGSAHWTELYSDAELTKDASFTPLVTAKETWAGWSISQSTLFSMLDAIDKKLGDLKQFGVAVSPIHRDIFAATDTLEFYSIQHTTIFYPKGLDRIFSILDPQTSASNYRPSFIERLSKDDFSASDKAVYQALVGLFGGEEKYIQYCQTKYNNPDAATPEPTLEIWNGNTYECLEGWIKSVLSLRRSKPSRDDKENFIEWQTKALSLLTEKIPYDQLLKTAQKDGFYLQVSVKGFRKGDHEAKDSEDHEVIASYISDSVGTADQYAGSGAFSKLADDTKITSYEINGLYFTGGI